MPANVNLAAIADEPEKTLLDRNIVLKTRGWARARRQDGAEHEDPHPSNVVVLRNGRQPQSATPWIARRQDGAEHEDPHPSNVVVLRNGRQPQSATPWIARRRDAGASPDAVYVTSCSRLPRDQGARLVPIENWDDASHVVFDSVDKKDPARVKKIVA